MLVSRATRCSAPILLDLRPLRDLRLIDLEARGLKPVLDRGLRLRLAGVVASSFRGGSSMDRASVFETEGCGFDPRPPRQPSLFELRLGTASQGTAELLGASIQGERRLPRRSPVLGT